MFTIIMKKNKYIRFIAFLVLNFLALLIGVFLMDNGPQSNWYQNLNQAPWTPENWVFGTAWSTIMICFAFYMTILSIPNSFFNKKLLTLYLVQWILNVSWNYLFFNIHQTIIGLIVIVLLWFLILYFTVKFKNQTKWYTLLILPYLIWLTIATSLNAYIVIYN